MTSSETIKTSVEIDQNTRNRELLRNSELGVFLDLAYRSAVDLDPRLKDVRIIPLVGDEPSLAKARPSWLSETGEHEIYVRLNDLDEVLAQHQRTLDNIPGAKKMFSQVTGIEPDNITPASLHVFSMLHEMGHITEFMDNENDPDVLRRRNKIAKTQLPIGNATVSQLLDPNSPARAFVDTNWDAISAHHGVATAEDLIEIQHTAYRSMPGEKLADEFAGDVFTLEPALVSSLSNPSGIEEYRTNYPRAA